ncbi:uncharacterized protein LOC120946027 [Rana temporaria]|uniref:uncharacterized protein LOC120946027 n=1 Tax=Rana temporaria TaxID=8407 RepID=UPI001AAD087F|nr:uncharacterized protein LOC120946027 [Rana temporaria]
MSEKVMRCRQKLSAAISRALENIHQPTNRDRPRSGPTNPHYSQPRGPSFAENTKKVTRTCQTDKGEKTTSKKEKVTPPSAIQRSPTRSESRLLLYCLGVSAISCLLSPSRSEELPADRNPTNTSQDLNDLIDNTSSPLLHQLSRSLDCDDDMAMDLIFGPGSFLSLLLDNEEPSTFDLTDPGTAMMDVAGHMMEAVLSPEDEPKSYCIL